jgi:antitoxin (DNA-binding transcriptional repressor) of toxin-antitoxin stability system
VKTVNMHEAKSTLSFLVKELATGAEPEIIIALGNHPAARLLPYGEPPKRTLGIDDGLFTIPDDFDDDEDVAELFENSAIFPDAPR